MSKASEEITKGLTSDILRDIIDYPSNQNIKVDGITWFKEDSYKGTDYDWLSSVFEKASKKQSMENKGTPDFMVVKDNSNVIVVIECKAKTSDHSKYSNLDDYKINGFGSADDTAKYAIDGALWYASFLSDKYDVVAIGVSGQNSTESKLTSFVWPKNGDIFDVELLADGTLEDSMQSINQYEKDIDIVLERFAATEAEVKKELRRYTLSCANFLRANGIEDNSKAGFVSAIILGLTNHESKLYKDTKTAIDSKRATKSKRMLSDPIGKYSVKMLKNALYGDGKDEFADDYIKGIWDIDNIPKGKRTALRKFYDTLLSKDELLRAPKGENKDFMDGDTVLSRCIYSLYENVVEVLEHYTGVDVMGEFYTTFLRFTKGNAKEKGIVLTPKHITELFCDIAEYYSDTKMTEDTKILDICCGTGAFLISALAKIKDNISAQKISETEKGKKYSQAQGNSLIGVERDPSMYALAYANMRFHGDGKSNLFNCSSLLVDSYAPIDDSGKTYLNDNAKIPLHEALASFGDIDIAMINPPYSLDKKEASASQNYEIILRKEECEGKIKVLKKKLSQVKKQQDTKKETIDRIQLDIEKQKSLIEEIKKKLEVTRMDEVVFSKGQDELDFIASMLHYLKIGGIGIAIVPMSCAGSSGTKLRSQILEHHTLLACMTMPSQLFFDSHVGTNTCIMVFKAHIPHDSEKSTFFGRWKEDGFAVVPHNGRKDTGSWNTIRKMWIDQMDGSATPNEYIWLKKKISINDEALAEAYVKTDYSALTDYDFEIVLKKYSLYKYMYENGFLEE